MSKEKKKRSTAQEDRWAEMIGGRRHAASGAVGPKDDASALQKFRIEAKYTDTEDYRLEFHVLDLLRRRALGLNEVPGFAVEFCNRNLEVVFTDWPGEDEAQFGFVFTENRSDHKGFKVRAEVLAELEYAALREETNYLWVLKTSYRTWYGMRPEIFVCLRS